MKLSPYQILRALQNNYLQARTPVGRIQVILGQILHLIAKKSVIPVIAKRCIKSMVINAYCHGWASHRMVVRVFKWLKLGGD